MWHEQHRTCGSFHSWLDVFDRFLNLIENVDHLSVGIAWVQHIAFATNDIVATGGCIVSELRPDVPGNRGTFPRRNRVISGLAEATVVVEAPSGSGALITASWTLEQGRECFVVPGPIDVEQSVGCNRLLRLSPGLARAVPGVAALLAELGLGRAAPPAAIGRAHMTDTRSSAVVRLC